jgi:hypothetical protein
MLNWIAKFMAALERAYLAQKVDADGGLVGVVERVVHEAGN